MEWIHVAQNRDKWQAVVNTTTYLQVPQHAEVFLGQLRTYQLFKKGSAPQINVLSELVSQSVS